MKRFTFAFCLLPFALSTGTVSAQMPPYNRGGFAPYNRPQIQLSPYLNMLRGGDPSANYFLGVVPERERRRNDAIFRNSLLDLEQRTQPGVEAEEFLPLRSTGHVTTFGNTSAYFGSSGLQQAPATRPPTQPAPRPVKR